MSASLPLMLSTMIGVVECSRICWQTSMPSHRGITRSSKMRSGSSRSNAAKASTPSLAVVILYPLVDREWLTAAIIPGSSSTSKMCSLAWPIVSLPLVHLHLTFSSLVCILSLKGRQEHCPFTTRLRVLKLGDVSLNLVYSQVRIGKENVNTHQPKCNERSEKVVEASPLCS